MAEEIKLYDVIIIGGGPAGVTASIYSARADLKTLVLDMSMTSGALGKTSKIANYPGIIGEISGEDLLGRMWQQAQAHGAEFAKCKVSGTDFSGEIKTIFNNDGQTYQARAVILATGALGRGSTLPGEKELLGRGVSYCATCDAAFFRDKEVVVYGDSDFAFEEALFLTRFVKRLHFVTPKAEYKEDLPAQVTLHTGTRIQEIRGTQKVESVVLIKGQDTESIAVDGVFIYVSGNKPVVDYLFGGAGTDVQACVAIDQEYRTNIPGVFACGDITCNAVQQVVVAASQGCVAALSADKYLRGREKLKKDYA